MSDEYQPHAVPASAIQSSQPKSTIIKRGNTKAKKGLGGKKTGGLGAHKVKAIDFAELEKDAEEADKAEACLSISSSGSEKKRDDKQSETSMRLAYEDIEKQEKQVDKKLSAMGDRKKAQAARLGMGMGKVDGVSHSLKMMTIDQQTPLDDRSRRSRYKNEDIFYDAKSSRRWMDDDEDDNDDDSWGRRDFSYKQTFSKTDTKSKPVRNDPPSYTIEPIEDSHKSISSVIVSNTSKDTNESSRQRKSQATSFDKFSDAKSISSDMVFGDRDRAEYEREQMMRNFEGRSAISSSDVFGDGERQSAGGSHNMPDLGNLKEGVRSVAGKMSSVMSGIASTIQDRYGT